MQLKNFWVFNNIDKTAVWYQLILTVFLNALNSLILSTKNDSLKVGLSLKFKGEFEFVLIVKFMNTCIKSETEIRESMRRETHEAAFHLIRTDQCINMIEWKAEISFLPLPSPVYIMGSTSNLCHEESIFERVSFIFFLFWVSILWDAQRI